MKRPDWDEYFVSIAAVVARRSDCLRRRAGAVIVLGRSIVSTGYDGTPIGVRNCSEGGCLSCAREAQPEQGYYDCLCVHAEANAILLAARHGTSVEGGILYTTARPCFGCLKESIQAGIMEIVYDCESLYEDEVLEEAYGRLVQESGLGMRRLNCSHASWTGVAGQWEPVTKDSGC